MRKRWLRIFIVSVVVLLLIVSIGFVAWATLVPEPLPAAIQAMAADSDVQVNTDQWLAFSRTDVEPTVGLIFYPGGRVNPQAYAPFAHDIAAEGYQVVIVPMPLNLAVFGIESAQDVIAAYPAVEKWAIGGHSLGGSMAARFVYDHADLVDGLVLWASYPEASRDLSTSDLVVTSIYGTLDGLATVSDIENTHTLLPESATMVALEGGNHAQFGWYGDQAGDNPATLSHEEQQAQTVAATIALLEQIGP